MSGSFDDAPVLATFTEAERNRLRYGAYLFAMHHIWDTWPEGGEVVKVPQPPTAGKPTFPMLAHPEYVEGA